jgi:CRISPR system Cascade subunit CasE
MIHLLHAPIDRRSFAAWAGGRGTAPGGVIDDGMALHTLLSAMFGKGVTQPFRLFAPATGDWSLYAYTAQSLDALRALADAVAPPEMLAVLPLERFRAKLMPAQFHPGTRLGFDLRVRPVKRGSREQDAFLWEALTLHAGDEPGMAVAGRTRESVYRDWLLGRLAGAAELECCRLTGFQRQRSWRDGRRVEGPDATLQGTLAIRDDERFRRLLTQGVGRHRAYGYGMLLLRPPDRPPSGR